MGVNRQSKRKHKKGCGCKLCKPHKGVWARFFKNKDRYKLIEMNKEIKENGI